ncbi:MAG: hypothetical protein CSA34_06985 [Desulfobulbus propionicus]|nr:MAG: hypothetical protein CSA34_06985 [Desulfobulbus propionicus]
MKKVLATGAALMMTAAVASTAAAEVNFKGDGRARAFYNSGYDFGNTLQPDGTYDVRNSFGWSSRVRLQFEGKAAGGAKAVARIRLIDTQWSGPEDKSLDKNIWADKAYIFVPFGETCSAEMGYTQLTVSRMTLDDVDIAGGKFAYNAGGLTVMPFFAWGRDGDYAQPADSVGVPNANWVDDNDAYAVGLYVAGEAADWTIGAAAWAVNDDNVDFVDSATGELLEMNDDGGWTGTIFVDGKIGAMTAAAELAFADADYLNSMDDGMGGFVELGFAADALDAHVTFAYTADGYVPDGDFGDISGWLMFGGGSAVNVVDFNGGDDIMAIGGHVNFTASDALSFFGNLVYATFDANDNGGSGLDNVWEVSGGLGYTISEGCTFDFVLGYLSPSLDEQVHGNDDAAFGAAGTLNVKF